MPVPAWPVCLLLVDLFDKVLVDDESGTVFIQPDTGLAKSPDKLPLSPRIEGIKPDIDWASCCTVERELLNVVRS